MPTFRFEFNAAAKPANRLAVQSWMNALELFGHVGRRWCVDAADGLAGVAETADLRAAAPERYGPRVRRALAEVEGTLGRAAIVTSAISEPRAKPPSLTLVGGVSREHSPIERGDDRSEVMPAATPLAEPLRRAVVMWQRHFEAADRLWLLGGEGEAEGHRQIGDVSSALLRRGRELAAELEAATGVPSYLYVHRPVGYAGEDATRKCPDCHRPFAATDATPGPTAYPFRCPSCRLVSYEATEVAGDAATERLAAVGWAGRVPGR